MRGKKLRGTTGRGIKAEGEEVNRGSVCPIARSRETTKVEEGGGGGDATSKEAGVGGLKYWSNVGEGHLQ